MALVCLCLRLQASGELFILLSLSLLPCHPTSPAAADAATYRSWLFACLAHQRLNLQAAIPQPACSVQLSWPQLELLCPAVKPMLLPVVALLA